MKLNGILYIQFSFCDNKLFSDVLLNLILYIKNGMLLGKEDDKIGQKINNLLV